MCAAAVAIASRSVSIPVPSLLLTFQSPRILGNFRCKSARGRSAARSSIRVATTITGDSGALALIVSSQ